MKRKSKRLAKKIFDNYGTNLKLLSKQLTQLTFSALEADVPKEIILPLYPLITALEEEEAKT